MIHHPSLLTTYCVPTSYVTIELAIDAVRFALMARQWLNVPLSWYVPYFLIALCIAYDTHDHVLVWMYIVCNNNNVVWLVKLI
jgi:hypothetical protein